MIVNARESAISIPPALEWWLSEISVANAHGQDRGRILIDEPDPATTIAWRSVPGEGSGLVVMGPRTRALYHAAVPGPSCVKARIQPGRASALLGRPVRGLVDRLVPLADLWEPGPASEHLARALADATANPAGSGGRQVAARLEEVLTSLKTHRRPADLSAADLVYQAGILMSAETGPMAGRVHATARRLHVSERHLRNLFADTAGVSPKQFVRLDRVRAVLARARQSKWAQLATELGYYDQSHLTAEFRRAMGVAPGAFVAGRLPPPSTCEKQATR